MYFNTLPAAWSFHTHKVSGTFEHFFRCNIKVYLIVYKKLSLLSRFLLLQYQSVQLVRLERVCNQMSLELSRRGSLTDTVYVCACLLGYLFTNFGIAIQGFSS